MRGLFHLRLLSKLNFRLGKKDLLASSRAQKISDVIIEIKKNTSIFDEIDEEIRKDIRQEISMDKSKKIFNFGQ